MRIKGLHLTAIAAGLTAVVMAPIANPPQASADPGVGGCVGVAGVSACANVGVPNINAVAHIPNIPVPNINVPHVNPGMFRGR